MQQDYIGLNSISNADGYEPSRRSTAVGVRHFGLYEGIRPSPGGRPVFCGRVGAMSLY